MRFRAPRKTALVAFVALALAQSAGAASRPVLVIPKLGLRATISYTSLEHGPWLWHHGQGNIAIAGHRVTHTHPFKNLDRLRRGDRIYLAGRTYVVRARRVLLPSDVKAVAGYHGLVLSACALPDGRYGPPAQETRRLAIYAQPLIP